MGTGQPRASYAEDENMYPSLQGVPPIVQALVIVFAFAATIIKSWLKYRRDIAQERWRTIRFQLALGETPAEQRSDIISACGELEAPELRKRSGWPKNGMEKSQSQSQCDER